jgi:hypothetical protein
MLLVLADNLGKNHHGDAGVEWVNSELQILYVKLLIRVDLLIDFGFIFFENLPTVDNKHLENTLAI